MSDIVIVTGSRDWPSEGYQPIWQALAWCNPSLVVHGGCKGRRENEGVDMIAARWARYMQVDQYVFEAKWGVHPNIDRSAGPKRNGRMVAAYPQATLLAFPLRGQTKGGTIDCMGRALSRGMRVFAYNGETMVELQGGP